MNRRISTLFCVVALILIAGILFGACGAKPETDPAETVATTEPTESGDEISTKPTKVSPDIAESTESSGDENVATSGNGDVSTPEATKPEATAPSVEAGVGERGDYENTPAETKPVGSKPADSKPTESKPAESKPADTKPAETTPGTLDTFDPENTTIEMWNAMTDEQQVAFQDSFPSLRDFIIWYNSAKAKQPTTETVSSGDNSVDLGQLIKP